MTALSLVPRALRDAFRGASFPFARGVAEGWSPSVTDSSLVG